MKPILFLKKCDLDVERTKTERPYGARNKRFSRKERSSLGSRYDPTIARDYTHPMQYGQQSNGKIISPRVNEEFQIALPETRTAGYRWTVMQKGEPHCELLEERADPGPAAAGGSGIHNWRFKAASSGTGKIEIRYGRSWKNTAPEKIFTMEVQVRP